jgi:hypothetical protein
VSSDSKTTPAELVVGAKPRTFGGRMKGVSDIWPDDVPQEMARQHFMAKGLRDQSRRDSSNAAAKGAHED